MVNDGSPDQSLELAVELAGQDEHVVVVDLSRNFGHHKAMMTGLAHASGDLVFLIDCDLEESPEWLTEFADTMEEKQCDVVYGVQQQRKGGWFERVSGQCFWSLFNTLSDISLPANIVTARLMTRRYVEALLQHQEREVFMAGLWHITGMTKLPRWYASLAMPSRRIPFAERCRYSSIRLPRLVTRRSSVSFISDSAFPFWQCCTFFGYSYIGFSSTDRQRVGLPLWRQSG